MKSIDIALIGVGQWGYNYLTTLVAMDQANVRWCCDTNPDLLPTLSKNYPNIRFTTTIYNVLEDKNVTGIVIVTPPHTHYSIAKMAIESGKHILMEKPFTLTYDEAEELIDLAISKHTILMAGHIMEYHPAISLMKHMMVHEQLGRILYVEFQRVNLRPSLHQINVLWDLAIHDFGIMRYLFDANPVQISAIGSYFAQPNSSGVAFITVRFPDNTLSHVYVSSIHPVKRRSITMIGEKKTVTFDDLKPVGQIKTYSMEMIQPPNHKQSLNGRTCSPQEDSTTTITINNAKPLKIQCEHFLECMLYDKEPLTGAKDILAVTRMVETAQRSLNSRGAFLDYPSI